MQLHEEIETLRARRAYYERLGKRLTVRAIDMRLAPLVEKQLRKEIRQDKARRELKSALIRSINL